MEALEQIDVVCPLSTNGKDFINIFCCLLCVFLLYSNTVLSDKLEKRYFQTFDIELYLFVHVAARRG